MRADSKDNGVSRLDFIVVFRQFNELSFAERSPLGSIENQHDIAPDLILKTILRAVDERQSEVVRHFSNLVTEANRNAVGSTMTTTGSGVGLGGAGIGVWVGVGSEIIVAVTSGMGDGSGVGPT